MNNVDIATGAGGEMGTSWTGLDEWKTVFDINLFGSVLILVNCEEI